MEIKMPKLGESVHEGTIEQWLVSVGDKVEEYEPLCEVITDKVTAEVPSSYAGTITEIKVEEGDTVAVDEIICLLDTGDEQNETEQEQSTNNQAEDVKEELQNKQTTGNDNIQNDSVSANADGPKNNGRYSPVVFKLASENQIDLNQVVGTGFEGRVTKKI